MTFALADDGVRLWCDDTGQGSPVVFAHEFAADARTWELQVRRLSRTFRCITFNARGYPPSDVPSDSTAYSADIAASDIGAVLDCFGIAQANLVGLSMGAYSSLLFAMRNPGRVRSLFLAGCGSGSDLKARDAFRARALDLADRLEVEGFTHGIAEELCNGPYRRRLAQKDPRAWREGVIRLSEHSAQGSAHTMRGIQAERESLYLLEAELRALHVPTQILVGDEDTSCIEPSLYLKRTLPNASLCMLPNSAHSLNLEEPAEFNARLLEFLAFNQTEVRTKAD